MEFSLDIIIPVFNEVELLPAFLTRIDSTSFCIKHRLIIIDDHSTDGSFNYLINYPFKSANLILRNSKNEGKGSAIRHCLSYVSATLVCIQDADLEYDPNDIDVLIKPLLVKQSEAVFGSRFMTGSTYSGNLTHTLANWLLTKIFNLCFAANLTDMETCYKVMHSRDLKSFKLKSDRFGIEPEFTAKLLKTKRRILEVPITYSGRTKKQGKKIGIMDGFAAIFHIIRFRFWD